MAFTLQEAGAVSGVASAISSVFASRVSAIGFEAAAFTAKVQAESRELTRGVRERALKVAAQQSLNVAKLNNLKLQKSYNDTASTQATMFATQGRSFASGSIQNILRQDQENLEWDKAYMTLTGEYENAALTAGAITPTEISPTGGFQAAAKLARGAGVQKGLLQLAQTAVDFKRIK